MDIYAARRSRLAELARNVEPVYNVANDLYKAGKFLLGKRRRAENMPPLSPQTPRKKGGPKKGKFGTMVSAVSGDRKVMKAKGKRKKRTKTVRKRVQLLEKAIKKQNWHKHLFLTNNSEQHSCAANAVGYTSIVLTNQSIFEQLLAQVPYQSTATPGTIANYNATSITVNTRWKMQYYTKTIFKNNYLYTCNLRCYIVKPKVQTGSVPENNISTGLTKQANPSISTTNAIQLYPTDSEDFKINWKIIKSCDMTLNPGDTCEVPYAEDFTYDQEYQDINTSTYNPKYGRLMLVRIMGTVAHDQTTTTLVGYSPAKVDVVQQHKLTLKKPSEAPLRTIHQTDNWDSLATSVVATAGAEIENAP